MSFTKQRMSDPFSVDIHCVTFYSLRHLENCFYLHRMNFFYCVIDNTDMFSKTLFVYDCKVLSKPKQPPERPPTCGCIKLK